MGSVVQFVILEPESSLAIHQKMGGSDTLFFRSSSPWDVILKQPMKYMYLR